MTSLFSTSFMCRLCGREVCNECFQQVIDLTQTPTNPSSAEYAAFMARRERHAHANPFFLACLKRKDHAITEFTPVTRFVESELDQAIRDMEAILEKEEDILPSVDYPVVELTNGPSNVNLPSTNQTYSAPEPGPSPDGLIESPSLQEQSPSDVRTEIPSTTLYAADTFPDPSIFPTYDDYTPSNVPEHITSIPIHRLQIIPASLYDPPQSTPSYSSKSPLVFSSLWVKGIPLLVKDVLPRFKLEWTPQYFMDRYGDQSCLIVECQTDENKRIDIREFFSKFGNYKDRQGCWKLKVTDIHFHV
jgi:lysine-specific demethylase 3